MDAPKVFPSCHSSPYFRAWRLVQNVVLHSIRQQTYFILLHPIQPSSITYYRSLHCLPVRQRVTLKTAVIVWKCLHGVAPAYLQGLCVPVDSVQCRPRLRSASTGSIQPPWVQTSIGQLSLGRQCGTVCQQTCVTTVYHRTPSRRSRQEAEL